LSYSRLLELTLSWASQSADRAPYMVRKEEKNTAAQFMQALKDIPNAQKIPGADYPVLRIFASAPGPANLERTTPKFRDKLKGLLSSSSPDKYPIAALNMETLYKIGRRFDNEWIKGEYRRRFCHENLDCLQ
jgi:hypothetical protein